MRENGSCVNKLREAIVFETKSVPWCRGEQNGILDEFRIINARIAQPLHDGCVQTRPIGSVERSRYAARGCANRQYFLIEGILGSIIFDIPSIKKSIAGCIVALWT